MRAAESDRRRDRGMPQQNLINFVRRDVLAAADDDVFDPAGQVQVTIVVEIALVSGAKPSVDESAGVCFRIIFVSAKYIRALNCDFAALIVFERIALFVHDPDAEAGAHPHRSGLAMARRQRIRSHLMRSFGHAVRFDERHAKFVFDFVNQFRRQGRAAGTDEAQRVRLGRLVVRASHQKLMHGRHAGIPGNPMLTNRAPERKRVELGGNYNGSSGKQSGHSRSDQAMNVEQRHNA